MPNIVTGLKRSWSYWTNYLLN